MWCHVASLGGISVSNPFEWTWGKADWGGLDLRVPIPVAGYISPLLENPALDWTVCPTDEHVSFGFGWTLGPPRCELCGTYSCVGWSKLDVSNWSWPTCLRCMEFLAFPQTLLKVTQCWEPTWGYIYEAFHQTIWLWRRERRHQTFTSLVWSGGHFLPPQIM